MTRRFLLYLAMACGMAARLSAGTVSYQISIDTSGFAANTPGFVDFQFNQANTGSLSGLATINSFTSAGYTFDEVATVASAGVTGSRVALPIVIPNNVGGANYYAQGVSVFGSSLTVMVTLSGPVIGGTATDPSQFFVFLEDGTGASLFGSEVASILVNNGGTTTPAGSTFAGGSARISVVTATPEPSTFLLGAGMLVLVAGRLRRDR